MGESIVDFNNHVSAVHYQIDCEQAGDRFLGFDFYILSDLDEVVIEDFLYQMLVENEYPIRKIKRGRSILLPIYAVHDIKFISNLIKQGYTRI